MAHQNHNNYQTHHQQHKRQETDHQLIMTTTNKILTSSTDKAQIDDGGVMLSSAQSNNNKEDENNSLAQQISKNNSDDDWQMVTTTTTQLLQPPPPIVYGELSILGYNGYIPNIERNGRRNRSKFLLCKRLASNGIKKSRHYIVKQQPQATKAIQDKDLHSISYTFSRSQTIIVEYRQDENTDMFQIGRSSEDPIDFVVMDTLSTNVGDPTPSSSASHHKHHHGGIAVKSSSQHLHNSNNSHNQHRHQQQNNFHHHPMHNENNQHNNVSGDILSGISRLHRHLAKVGDEIMYGNNQAINHRNRLNYHRHQSVLLNYPQPNMSNIPSILADHFRLHESALFQQQQQQQQHVQHHTEHNPSINSLYQSSSSRPQQLPQQAHQQQIQSSIRTTNHTDNMEHLTNQHHCSSSRHNNNNNNISEPISSKRSHATQSTISRFACRILVDRHPPYTARIYAAGFDSSKNIFLGEKATKWEQNNTIDGLTTNGVLLMHPKSNGDFYEQTNKESSSKISKKKIIEETQDSTCTGDIDEGSSRKQLCSTINNGLDINLQEIGGNLNNNNSDEIKDENNSSLGNTNKILSDSSSKIDDSKSIITNTKSSILENELQATDSGGGVWREVSVDGGIYAIRESRSAAQKGTRIESESNILQDGTLIDLCGATLLWRSVDGFKASPTKKSLEEKIDMLNASRPQCPVGLNTLVIPRKPIIPAYHQQQQHSSNNSHHNHHHHHHQHHRLSKGGESSSSSGSKNNDKSSHQPYVYLKCGHVQGYHDWGATDKLNQRTCPICLSVGTVAKLSMGLEPSFYVDSGPLTHVFNPCGHMASEKTVKYWCSIKIPHGTHFFHSICPFCATPLETNETASTKLIFQDDLD